MWAHVLSTFIAHKRRRRALNSPSASLCITCALLNNNHLLCVTLFCVFIQLSGYGLQKSRRVFHTFLLRARDAKLAFVRGFFEHLELFYTFQLITLPLLILHLEYALHCEILYSLCVFIWIFINRWRNYLIFLVLPSFWWWCNQTHMLNTFLLQYQLRFVSVLAKTRETKKNRM